MDNTNQKETFSYTYSASEQEEIKMIREKYLSCEENKMEQLRRLDNRATKKGTVAAIIIGVIGALILGTGMSMCMEWEMYITGIIVGIMGMIGIVLAYPVYVNITKKEREKIAPEIMRLTAELLK